MYSSRGIFLMVFLLCASMLGLAAYFQIIDHLEPCPLCVLQRVFILFVGIVMLLAVLHNPKGLAMRLYGLFAGIIALGGASISARHVWLQNLPADQVPSCGPGLSFMLDNFPLNDTIKMVMRGSGECAEVLWTLMGLSIPAWTLVAFVLIMLLAWCQAFRGH